MRLSFVSVAVVAGALAYVPTTGCTTESNENEVTIFAAASLTDSFKVLADDFEAQNPGTHVVLAFAGSHTLRTQIEHGARADIFASADQTHMDALSEKNLIGKRVLFAKNRLVIVVPKANPSDLHSFKDLARASRLVLAEASVPAGRYAEAMLRNATRNSIRNSRPSLGGSFAKNVIDRAVSREPDVRHVLQKVILGEADAAIVYATDAAMAKDAVRIINIPDEFNVTASYPISTVKGASGVALADRFINYVRSESGQSVLERHGFRPVGVITAGR